MIENVKQTLGSILAKLGAGDTPEAIAYSTFLADFR